MSRGGTIIGVVLVLALTAASPAFALLLTPQAAPAHHCCPKTAIIGAHMPMPDCPCCADSSAPQAPPSVPQVPVTHAKVEPAQAASAAIAITKVRPVHHEKIELSLAQQTQAALCTFLI